MTKPFDHHYANEGCVAVPCASCEGCAFNKSGRCTLDAEDTMCCERPDGHSAVMLKGDAVYQHDILIPFRLTLYTTKQNYSEIPLADVRAALQRQLDELDKGWTDHVEHAENHRL